MSAAVFFKAVVRKAAKFDKEAAKAAVAKDLAGLIAPAKEPGADDNLAAYASLLALLQGMNAGAKFGQHNVNEGDHVSFAAGEFKGSGKVTARGEHGVTVQDKSSREHRVHWHEVSGHAAGEPGSGKEGKDAKK